MIVNPGIRRFLGSAIQRLFNGAAFALPLTHTAVPTRGGIVPTFTRATTETGQRWDEAGYLNFTALAGEIVFKGARRVRNILAVTSTENMLGGGFSYSATVNSATSVSYLALGNQLYGNVGSGTPAIGTKFCVQVMLSGTPGNTINLYVMNGAANSGAGTQITLTATPTVYSVTGTVTNSSQHFLWLMPASYLTVPAATAVQTITATKWQAEDVTGQTTQTASEYVSVGALIHNSQDPNFLSLPGTAGHYASTPDTAANSITGDIAFAVKARCVDYTIATNQTFVSKYTGGDVAWMFEQSTASNVLRFYCSVDGTAVSGPTSSVGHTFADNTTGYFGVKRIAATGVVTFYTSTDGATWTPLGTPQASTAGALFNSTRPLEIGSWASGAGQMLNGSVFEVCIYNGIPPIFGGAGSATPVVDFNPDRDAATPTGTITSSTTGEVWTINGASSVVRNAAYHGSMVDGVACFDYYYLD